MPLRFLCPDCGKPIVTSRRMGERASCGACRSEVVVPVSATEMDLRTEGIGGEVRGGPPAELQIGGGEIPPVSAEAKKEITRDIIGSAIIGGVLGYLWGVPMDPWGHKGLAPAVLNFLVFAGWGVAECLGAVLARNLKIARSRRGIIVGGAIVGGIYVGICWAIYSLFDPDVSAPSAFLAAFGFMIGLVLGGVISALSLIKVSRLLAENLPPAVGPPVPGFPAGPPPLPGSPEREQPGSQGEEP
jgi:hypothetical protein